MAAFFKQYLYFGDHDEGGGADMQLDSESLVQNCSYQFARGRSLVLNALELAVNSKASRFYRELLTDGYLPNVLIDVVPEHRLLYIHVPKCASTTIRRFLSQLIGRSPPVTPHIRKASGLKSPRRVGIANFYRIAMAPDALRFTFVRNPYNRLVSAWANKFRNKPLIPGDRFIDQYLTQRMSIDSSLPHGPDAVLTFADFVTYATATAESRVDIHWQSQADIISMPGISLDLVGRVESFATDFSRVLRHVNAPDRMRREILASKSISGHKHYCEYFTPELAKRVYRAYERDFDLLHYPHTVPG